MQLLRRAPVTALLVLLVGLLVACGPTTSGDDDGGGGGQKDAAVVDQGGSEVPVDPPQPDAAACFEQTITPAKIGDPSIIILMDMSGSMTEGTPTKYEQTADAVTSVVTQLETAGAPIWWGLIFFPTDGDCAVDPSTLVAPAAGNATTISTTITGTSPGGNTPAHKAVKAGADYYAGLGDDGRAHYLLIATDGQPNCDPTAPVIPKGCDPANPINCAANEICQPIPFLGGMCVPADGGPATAAITEAAAAGVKTYVIGIDLDGVNATMNKMAEAGGTARAGTTKYYPVADQAEMVSALENITEQIISCTFEFDYVTDLQYVSVTVGGAGVSRDPTHANGWDIDQNARTLTFYGDTCTALQTNPETVHVVVGCPPIS